MSLDKAAWAEIQRVYQTGGETVAAIAARFGVSEGAIYRRARRDGWARRSKTNNSQSRSKGKAKPGGKAKKPGSSEKNLTRGRKSKPGHKPGKSGKASKKAATRDQLIERLYKTIDAKLSRLEQRIDADHDITAAESERETRELGSMIRSFEKVAAFAKTLQGRTDKQRKSPVVDPGDAERMREEIAQRLERLYAQGETRDKPGTPE